MDEFAGEFRMGIAVRWRLKEHTMLDYTSAAECSWQGWER